MRKLTINTARWSGLVEKRENGNLEDQRVGILFSFFFTATAEAHFM